jgi:hypothetical protein
MLLPKKQVSLLILFLSFFSAFVAYPLVKTGLRGVFYAMDPDVVLIGNALSYIKSNIIHYRDHPGTPLIFIIALSYWPLRIYAKLVDATPFITWVFENVRFVYMYTRVIQLSIFLISIATFLTAVFKSTKSLLIIIIAWMLLFTFSVFPHMSTKVFSENGSFMFIALWLLIFAGFVRINSPRLLSMLSILSGIAVAQKYNNFVLVLISIVLVFGIASIKFTKKLSIALFNFILVVLGFVIGTWPVRSSYVQLFKRLSKVAGQSGPKAAHGAGKSAFFDLSSISDSLLVVFKQEEWFFLTIMLAIVLFVYFYHSRRLKQHSLMFIGLASLIISTLLILKYSTSYYQLPNFLVAVFIFSYMLKFASSRILLVIIIILMPVSYRKVSKYLIYTEKSIVNLLINKPNLLELKSDYMTVHTSYTDKVGVFDICWDKLYIRENRAKVLLDKYSDRELMYAPIVKGKYGVVWSNHCTTKL